MARYTDRRQGLKEALEYYLERNREKLAQQENKKRGEVKEKFNKNTE